MLSLAPAHCSSSPSPHSHSHSHPKAPAQQRSLPLSSGEGTSIRECRRLPQLLSSLWLLLSWVSSPFPHELLVHWLCEFLPVIPSDPPLLLLPSLSSSTCSSLETKILKHHLLCATSYSPADRGLHFYHLSFLQQ